LSKGLETIQRSQDHQKDSGPLGGLETVKRTQDSLEDFRQLGGLKKVRAHLIFDPFNRHLLLDQIPASSDKRQFDSGIESYRNLVTIMSTSVILI
jgi:hypothetical protein